jgi:hypothetical protein
MTPNRTAPPVARMQAERPVALPLLPPEPLVLVGEVVSGGVVVSEDWVLLPTEDNWEETLEVLNLTGDTLEVTK